MKKKNEKEVLIYGNHYHIECGLIYLGIAECRLVDGKIRWVQKYYFSDGNFEERECYFATGWYLATDEEIERQNDFIK
jgi:hypothetical protein